MEGQRGEFGTVFFEFEFDIFADEEIRIRKARAEDVFVSFADGVNVDIVAVADGDEMREKTEDGGRWTDFGNRKIALVFFHYRDQNITR